MSPQSLIKDKLYMYGDLKLKYSHETINHYMFIPVDNPDDGYWKLTHSQAKELIEI